MFIRHWVVFTECFLLSMSVFLSFFLPLLHSLGLIGHFFVSPFNLLYLLGKILVVALEFKIKYKYQICI